MVTFASDERGVSEVLGAILVFGLVLTLLAIVQVQGVPAANERVELKHSEDVQEDLGSLQGAISRTAVTGSGESVRVDVGLRYPSRFVLINPPPATGTLRTEEPKELELANAWTRDEEVQDYLDGSSELFSTRSIVYGPGYNRLDDAGKTVFETGIRYKQFGDGSTSVQDRGALVDGRTISIITIDGELSESTAGSTTLSTRPLSTSHQVVTVTDRDANSRGDPLTLKIPTDLSENTWRNEVLGDEYDRSQSNPDKYVKAIDCEDTTIPPEEPCPEGERMVIKLDEKVNGERVTYNLRMAEIGVGSGTTDPEPHYITTVRGDGEHIPVGKSQKLTAQVRDRHNNPVSGVDVTFSSSGGDFPSGSTVTTDENGHATVKFKPTSSDPTVTASAGDLGDENSNVDDYEEATFAIDSGAPGPIVLEGADLPPGGEQVQFTLKNEGNVPLEFTHVQLDYITVNQQVTKQLPGGPTTGSITVTQLFDGPDEIESVSGAMNSLSANAVEHDARQEVDGTIGTTSDTVTFTFDSAIDVGGNNEFAMVSITVYYQGGHSETYAVHLGQGN